ncbi:MAG: hypothetical protein KIT33_03730 [Candidatus Kapabacteria bacterium]|nr:hypothetical protein [Ignavibacteriota bacterium]MCW5884063.1 hypothetical protein [Candidatus Kapabacteria bacterium]MCW5919434.1 hypothetical protein [Bacteroidota bacterium]
MKYTLTLLVFFTVELTFAQSILPDFLLGTWKMENKEVYEHWDKLNENTLKGFSYKLKDGQMLISEYLDIRKVGKEILYSATVLKQNSGNPVDFKLTKTDSTYIFENPNHDFPKKIVYQRLTDTEIYVQVSDGKQKGFAYKMQKEFQKAEKNDSTITNPNYDKTLAEKLGGDDYGMKSYFLVILKTGTNNTTDKELIAESFRGHMDNINRLVKEGKLVVAGPLGKNENNYRGIFILNNIKTIEETKELLQTDLAIKNGLLDYDIFTWYGSAALPEYLPFSDKIFKIKP